MGGKASELGRKRSTSGETPEQRLQRGPSYGSALWYLLGPFLPLDVPSSTLLFYLLPASPWQKGHKPY